MKVYSPTRSAHALCQYPWCVACLACPAAGSQLQAAYDDGETVDDHLRRVGMPTGGAVRVSLGLASNDADIRGFLAFAAEFRDLECVPQDLPPRLAC